jgi:hypothetical protein
MLEWSPTQSKNQSPSLIAPALAELPAYFVSEPQAMLGRPRDSKAHTPGLADHDVASTSMLSSMAIASRAP